MNLINKTVLEEIKPHELRLVDGKKELNRYNELFRYEKHKLSEHLYTKHSGIGATKDDAWKSLYEIIKEYMNHSLIIDIYNISFFKRNHDMECYVVIVDTINGSIVYENNFHIYVGDKINRNGIEAPEVFYIVFMGRV